MASEATTGQQLADEALRVYNAVRHTTYSHKNHVDVETGTYNVDCNGFVGFVLKEAAPQHFAQITPEPRHKLPRAFIYAAYFANLPSTGTNDWLQVPRLADARPGDIIAWSLTDPPPGDKNTGHVVVVADDPVDKGDNKLSVRVYDSSDVIHHDDTRGVSPRTGVGIGTIWFSVGVAGNPTAFQFGPNDHFHPEPIAIGRLQPLEQGGQHEQRRTRTTGTVLRSSR
jgi:hypothetical protein